MIEDKGLTLKVLDMVVVYPHLDPESGEMVHIYLDNQGLMDQKLEMEMDMIDRGHL